MQKNSKDEKNKLNIEKQSMNEEKKNNKKALSKSSTNKSKVTTKSSSKKATSKKNLTKKSSNKISTTKNTSSKKKVLPVKSEYYDLPFRYNQTVVKILAQTPNKLFIYWDISDEDRKNYEEKYGKDFFYNTRPYLIITNNTMNYTFEVEINDFANSWYLNINDANCDYKVELARKFITNSKNTHSTDNLNLTPYFANDTLTITSSNILKVPNDHILFEDINNNIFFRNVKTNILEEKNISSLSFLQRIGKIHNIYDLYKHMYYDEIKEDELNINLSSSSNSNFN